MTSDSLWLAGHRRKYGALEGSARADVAVVGGGVAGLTAAYLLTNAGVGVAVLEADAVGSGASGHGAAHVTALPGLRAAVWTRRLGAERAGLFSEAGRAGLRLLSEIVGMESIDCGFELRNAFLFTERAEGLGVLEAEAEAARGLGILADIVTTVMFPFPCAAAVRVPGQAALHPVRYLDALAAAIARRGGRIHENSRVTGCDGGMVTTQRGCVAAKCVLVAAHLPEVFHAGRPYARLCQGRAFAVALDGAPAFGGLWTSADGNGCQYRRYAGLTIVSGRGRNLRGDGVEEGFARLRAHACERFPGSQPSGAWTHLFAETQDGLPFVGRAGDQDRTAFAAAGFGMEGIALGTLAGQLLCDLVLDRPNPYAGLFLPRRPSAPGAMANVIRRLHDRRSIGHTEKK